MSKGSLLLHPVNPDTRPDLDELESLLEKLGLIGTKIGKLRWNAGKAFLQLLTFMGCSPHVQFEPQSENDDDFCHVSFRNFNSPVMLASINSRPCRCRSCGKPIVTGWQLFDANAEEWQCPHCGHKHQHLSGLRWRNDAGFASLFIEIHSIYPGEAQPIPSMMQQLKSLTGEEWRYFYLHSND